MFFYGFSTVQFYIFWFLNHLNAPDNGYAGTIGAYDTVNAGLVIIIIILPIGFLFSQDTFVRNRRQTVDSTSGAFDKTPTNTHSINGESNTNSARRNDTAVIYFITPTYPRREQIAELTRLGQTLMHVSRLYWIVADDRPDCSLQIMNLLPDFSENNVQ